MGTRNTVAELLRSSRLLLTADNPIIASVFINPDLTPAAAKLAFEERQQRRQKRATRSQGGSTVTRKNYDRYGHFQNANGTLVDNPLSHTTTNVDRSSAARTAKSNVSANSGTAQTLSTSLGCTIDTIDTDEVKQSTPATNSISGAGSGSTLNPDATSFHSS